MEEEEGDSSRIEAVKKRMPTRLKKKRPVETEDGAPAGWEEYYDYIFPEEQAKAPSLKILEMAHKWKKQKVTSLASCLLKPKSRACTRHSVPHLPLLHRFHCIASLSYCIPQHRIQLHRMIPLHCIPCYVSHCIVQVESHAVHCLGASSRGSWLHIGTHRSHPFLTAPHLIPQVDVPEEAA